ncbi:MAG: hypothetical protein H6686_02410 [Fibrobacteria bacterium]|nr:hypothetical protein [Fibrobacteria bacterium]
MLKTFWFWFLTIWILLVVATTTTSLVLLHSLPWWGWTAAGLGLATGLAIGLILRQRALIRALARGAKSDAADAFEDTWKAPLLGDLRKLASASATDVQSGVFARSDFESRLILWGISRNPAALKSHLEELGARNLTTSRSHELSGGFAEVADWLVVDQIVVILPRTLPDSSTAPNADRIRFLVEGLQELGKVRPVDAALVHLHDQATAGDRALHGNLAFLAEASATEFPVHILLPTPKEFSPGLAELLTTLPGARLPWGRQENLPKSFDEAWSRLQSGLEEKEPGLLARAWESSLDPQGVYRSLQILKSQGAVVKERCAAIAAGFTTKSPPFLRGFYFLASGSASADGGDSAQPRDILRIIASEPSLARLAAHRQVKASVLATLSLLGSAIVAALLVVVSLHGSFVGGRMVRSWNQRLQAATISPWETPEDMASSLGSLLTLDSLYTEITRGRPWSLAPGFYPGSEYKPKVSIELQRRLGILNTTAFASQEALVGRLVSQATHQDADLGELYREFKTYLLISKDGWSQGEDQEGTEGLSSAIVHAWANTLGLSDPLPPQVRDALPRLAEWVVRHVEDEDEGWLGALDPTLAHSTRLQLGAAKNQSGNFARILAAADTLPSFNSDSLGLKVEDLGCSDFLIPPAYTRRGWLEAIEPTLTALANGKPDWVLGSANEGTASSKENIVELRRRYVDGFVEEWAKLFETSRCKLPSDNQRLAGALQILSSPYNRQNPKGLLAFLSRFLEETDLSPEAGSPGLPPKLPGKLDKMAKKAEAIVDAVSARLPPGEKAVHLRVAEGLSAQIAWAQDATKGSLTNYSKDLQALAVSLGDQGNGKDVMEFAGAVLRQDPKNPLVHGLGEASAIRDKLPAGLHGWWDGLSRDILLSIARNLVPIATEAANTAFREQVWQPWQNLVRGNYPFDPYAETEASIDEIDHMINPQTGAVALYLKSIENIVDVQGDDIQPRTSNGIAPALDATSLQGLRKILRLGAFFYGKGGGSWKGCNTTISIKGDSRAKVEFRLGGQAAEAAYGGEKRIVGKWPQKGQSGVALVASTITSNFEERRDGEWALLRLFDLHSAGMTERVFSFKDKSYIVDIPVSVRLDVPGGPFLDKEFFKVTLNSSLFR